jgi:pectinesterase
MLRRQFLGAGLAAATLAACRTAPRSASTEGFAATVLADGSGSHPTLTAAIADAPPDGTRPYRVLVGAGHWREKLVVDRPNIHLVGADRAASVLFFDAAAGQARPDGQPWGTWGCASVIVRARDFSASRLSIANTFDYLGNLDSPHFQPIGPNGLQAVALMLDQGADRCVFTELDLHGHQDTLFVDAGRSVFRRCRITGSVDFVFGGGRALFQDCELQSRARPANKPRQGYIAVPSTPAAQDCGLVFDRCRLTREAAVPDRSVALGRAWRPGKTFPDGRYGDPGVLGSAVYRSCWMDAHVDTVSGWDPMAYTARDGQRVMLEPQDARLFEFDSRGPGAARSPNRRWLDAAQAAAYAPARVLAGWEPAA